MKDSADKINRGKIPEGMIEMRRAARQVRTNMLALKISDRMAKSVLDVYG